MILKRFYDEKLAQASYLVGCSVTGEALVVDPNRDVEQYIEAAEQEFDLDKQNQLLANVHEIVVDDAPWVFIVHDLNPRAMSPKVKGFVQPQSWFVDLTSVSVTK